MSRHHTEKDKKRAEQEKLQLILNRLLREEENKYCADCEAKGPRWASWNLGVFLCIRCAGIHRNLGVHLSKVKSVNLDSWTPEQVQHMRVIGNSVGKAVYEATLPEHFRRPQTDSALEAFIRGKYEHKRYLMKDYVPAKINPLDLITSEEWLKPTGGGSTGSSAGTDSSGGKGTKKTTLSLEQKPAQIQSKRDSTGNTGKDRVRRRSSNAQQPPNLKVESKTSEAHSASVATALNDLVDLDVSGSSGWITASAPNLVANSGGGGGLDDLLGLNAVTGQTAQDQPAVMAGHQPSNSNRNGLAELNQDLLFGATGDSSEAAGQSNNNGGGIKKTKNDILALYGSGGANPAQQAQAPMMAGVNYNMPPAQQIPFSGMQGQVLNFNMTVPANSWTMNENPAAFGNVQPSMLCDPLQQNASGFVATPFGYVPVAPTQQPAAQFSQQIPNMAANNSTNLHLQSIQQQLASLQLQRTQPQQQQPVTQPPQDTLATSLWH